MFGICKSDVGYELLIYTFAEESSFALKMLFLCKFTDGSMLSLPW